MKLEARLPSPIDAEVLELHGVKIDDADVLHSIRGLDLEMCYYSPRDWPVGLVVIIRDSRGKIRDRCVLRVGPTGRIRIEHRIDRVNIEEARQPKKTSKKETSHG